MKTDPVITKTKFRLMIIFSLIFALISGVIDSNNETYWMIDEILYSETKTWELIIICILSLGFVVVTIGLLVFREWGRKLYVYGFFPILLIFLLPSMSWTYYSGLAGIFYDLSNILSTLLFGILIVPSLYQPLFQQHKLDA